jgi:hypothetical protein
MKTKLRPVPHAILLERPLKRGEFNKLKKIVKPYFRFYQPELRTKNVTLTFLTNNEEQTLRMYYFLVGYVHAAGL